MSAPAANASYQSTMLCSAVSQRDQRMPAEPLHAPATESSLRYAASWGWGPGSASQSGLPDHRSRMRSTIHETGRASPSSGPKFQPSANASDSHSA